MTPDDLQQHAERLPVVAVVDCPFRLNYTPVERCRECEFCARCSPLMEHVECGYAWAWRENHKEAR
jgi:hypothetical protein